MNPVDNVKRNPRNSQKFNFVSNKITHLDNYKELKINPIFMFKLPTCLYKKFKSKQSTSHNIHNQIK
jgi:hypothetical protein